MRREIEEWLPSVTRDGDRVLIYFAGHGFVAGGKPYLAPWDVKLSDVASTGYSMARLGEVFGSKIRFSWDRVYSLLRRYFNNTLAPLNQVLLADYNGKLLYDWIPANAAFSRALDIQIMSLFLTSRMTDFATHLPWQLKYCQDTDTGKLLLRSLLKKQGLTAEPVKKGFSINTVALWKRSVRETVERYVNSDAQVVKAGVISGDWVEKARTRLKDAPDYRHVNKMLGMLALEVWWRLFVSRSMKKSERL